MTGLVRQPGVTVLTGAATKSIILQFADLAQLVERSFRKAEVVGSSPMVGLEFPPSDLRVGLLSPWCCPTC